MTTIRNAIDALNERKSAVVRSNPGTLLHTEESGENGEYMDAGGVFTETQFRQMLVGFDLDLDELVEEGEGMVKINKKTLVSMVTRGRNSSEALTDTLMSVWFDGILTGIKFKELQDKED